MREASLLKRTTWVDQGVFSENLMPQLITASETPTARISVPGYGENGATTYYAQETGTRSS